MLSRHDCSAETGHSSIPDVDMLCKVVWRRGPEERFLFHMSMGKVVANLNICETKRMPVEMQCVRSRRFAHVLGMKPSAEEFVILLSLHTCRCHSRNARCCIPLKESVNHVHHRPRSLPLSCTRFRLSQSPGLTLRLEQAEDVILTDCRPQLVLRPNHAIMGILPGPLTLRMIERVVSSMNSTRT